MSDKGNPSTTARAATPADAESVAALSCQLGYPSLPQAVHQRLERIQRDDNRAVYVAELAGGGVVGWIEVFAYELLIAELRAEIEGLIVDERYRGAGIGRQLIGRAEAWAKGRGCKAVYLRSNIIRERAHAFYRNLGYETIKTQLAFEKRL